MQPRDTSQEQGLEEGETGSPVSRRADGRADFLFCLFSWTQFVAKGKNKPDRHLQKALPNEGYVQVAGGRQQPHDTPYGRAEVHRCRLLRVQVGPLLGQQGRLLATF